MTCHIGDCREVMRRLIAEGVRVQMCVTSPPYWGLRDYGTAQWEGGHDGCDHQGPPVRTQAGFNERYFGKQFAADKQGDEREPMGQVCKKCNARRIDQQLGLESTPAEYVANMVEVFGLVRDLLADDGTLWLNLGDSYAGGGGYAPDAPCNVARRNGEQWGALNPSKQERREARKGTGRVEGIKPKDLVGIPWRVAFALQADGWYLRQDIIWAKPNPMPESVTDRCTKAHEYLFLLAKRERYYFDAEAIREEQSASTIERFGNGHADRKSGKAYHVEKHEAVASELLAGRNKRSVWTVPTAPYADAHFATFPPALIEPCIMAGSRVGDVVLDPFMGSGTVGQVAQDLGRRWLGIELNEAYAKLQERRTAQQAMVFT